MKTADNSLAQQCGSPKPARISSIDPYDWSAVLNASRAEGYNMVHRLLTDYRSGTNRFDAPGEALFAHVLDSCVVAVAGLNRESDPNFPHAGRVRRVYVMPKLRGTGLGRSLLEEMLAAAAGQFDTLTVNVGQLAARGFYEHFGFAPVNHPGITHVKQLPRPL
jgi:GNAT superfamily N-acetyltransferase